MITKVSRSHHFVLVSSVLVLLACNLLQMPQQPVETAAVSGPEGPAGEALFQDDFSNPASGVWFTDQTEAIVREHMDGEFRIFVDNDESSYVYPSTWTQQDFGDVRIEVDVRRVSGPEGASAYLLCRRADQRQYIFGDVDFEGKARIGLVSDDMQEILADEEGIAGLREGVNRLRMDCIGNIISLYANGNLVASAEVNGPSEGAVGFAAGGIGSGQTDFRFDNFVVYKP
jgi:hypothetical protein